MVYGGFSPSGMLNASEEYGGATWTATPNLNTARGQNAGFGIQQQRLLVVVQHQLLVDTQRNIMGRLGLLVIV